MDIFKTLGGGNSNKANAAKILDVAVTEATNRRLEIQKEQKAYELKIEQAKMDGIKQQHDFSVDVLREEAKTHRTKAEYEDYLARKRGEDRAKQERESQLELMKLQEDSVKKQEKIRKGGHLIDLDTIDYEYAKKVASDKELSSEFWKNKSLYKKETKDLSMAKYSMKMDSEVKKAQVVVK